MLRYDSEAVAGTLSERGDAATRIAVVKTEVVANQATSR
jgi:hypothetical protein